MSAIVGLVYFDGRTDREGVLQRMMQAIAHRGADGMRYSTEGSAGLGHLALHTTPESVGDRVPHRMGRGFLTADARLDHFQPGRPDAGVIYEAWKKFGEDCPRELFGDFAFAIWEEEKQRLFCARDQIGVRPFYYFHKPGSFFVFASQIRALFAHPEVPRRLNRTRVAQALAAVHTDQSSTYYEGICRLPAAHTLTVSKDGLRLKRYWALDAERESSFGSDEEAIDGFREVFTNAVRNRMRAHGKLAVELSGGLDSSAVACVARDLSSAPLATYSAIFPSVAASDERRFIDAVLRQPGFAPVFVNGDEAGPLGPFERFLDYEDEGSYGTNFFLRDALHRAMQRDGVRVLLDGFDGDTTVGHGNLRLAELAAARDWAAFDRELETLCRRNKFDPGAAALMYGGAGLKNAREAAPHFRRSWGSLFAATRLRDPLLRRFAGYLRGERASWRRRLPTLLNADFGRAVGIGEMVRIGEREVIDECERARLVRLVNSGSFAFGLERYDYHAAATGMECRHPFCDARLIEFSAGLPSRFKLADGFNRWIMRKALEMTMPADVAWRVGKGNLTHNFLEGLLVRDAGVLKRWLFVEHALIERVVNVPVAREVYLEFAAGGGRGDEQALFSLFRVLTSARWLAHTRLVS